MKQIECALVFAVMMGGLPLAAETVKDREGAVRKDRETMQNDARWIYNDAQRGFDEAKRTGKPLMVVLRCVPCMSCMGMDGAVLTEPSLTPLLDSFVCVRLINANAIDLTQFQFDYDLSFSTIFFNGDGTVYGRFGSWTHQKNPHHADTASIKRALESALAIHRGYPANKESLAGKQGVTMPFKTAVEIPLLAGKYQRELDWDGKVVGSCVHCHQIGDAFRSWYRDQRKPMPDEWLYPMPSPETVGLTLSPDQVAHVDQVAGGSPAGSAGLQAGDDIVALGGQPLVSLADFSWVLHRAPAETALSATVMRKGETVNLTLNLPDGWRSRADSSRRVGAWPMRGMATGGMSLEDMNGDARVKAGFTQSQLALLVKGVGQYGKHAAAKNAGFQKDDIILELDGIADRMTESQVFGHLLKKRMPGEKVKVKARRGQQQVELLLPMQ